MQTAEKLSITLPAEMVRIIREKISAATCSSNCEVIREALRSWMEREQRLAALEAAIVRGVTTPMPDGRKKSEQYSRNCGSVLNHESCCHERG